MKLIDLNILIYAVNRDAPPHRAARTWLEATLSGSEAVGLAWTVILGFLRLTTNGRIVPQPLSPKQAIGVVDGWLQLPCVRVVDPSDRHWSILQDLLAAGGTAGNLTTDAHLAALAIEYGARLYSTDHDFARFKGLRWANPLA